MITIVLAEDQALVREALTALLDLQPDFHVLTAVARGDEVLDAVTAHSPDVVLLDIEMPGLDGLAAAAALRDNAPTCKTIILTTFGRPGYLHRAMAAGARGFVVKDAPADHLADTIRRVVSGALVVDPTLAAAALTSGTSPLTPRERDTLTAARSGATIAEMATTLSLSQGTVRNYLSSASAKTGTRNRMEAVRVAEERGWL